MKFYLSVVGIMILSSDFDDVVEIMRDSSVRPSVVRVNAPTNSPSTKWNYSNTTPAGKNMEDFIDTAPIDRITIMQLCK